MYHADDFSQSCFTEVLGSLNRTQTHSIALNTAQPHLPPAQTTALNPHSTDLTKPLSTAFNRSQPPAGLNRSQAFLAALTRRTAFNRSEPRPTRTQPPHSPALTNDIQPTALNALNCP